MDVAAARQRLVGRERELARVEALLARAGPGALALEGEPGIGKTTIWRAGVKAAAERGRFVLQARPVEAEADLSFSGLADLLEPALDRLGALPPPRRLALEIALLLAAGEHAPPDARAVGLATLDLLRLLAEEQPLVVAIDDTQWLDRPSRDALAYALRRLETQPVAFLSTRRPGADANPLGAPERVVVGPLSVGALHELIRSRVSTRVTRPTLVRIHETSGGNPFFALELARALEGRELRPGEPLPVPDSLAGLTAARFERLDADAREVLSLVAALAHPTVEVVTAAAGERAGPALAAARAAGVIEVDGSRLRFTHPLLASVLYGAATEDDRARVHRRLAEVVTEAEERGRHLGAAASAPDPDVAAALDEAAAEARGRGAPAAAADLAETAIRLTPEADSASLRRRLCVAADLHFAAGSTAHARSLLERALAGAPRGRERAQVALQLALHLDSQDMKAEQQLLAQALREAEGDPGLRARVHDRLSIYFQPKDWREARRHAHIAVGLAERAGDPPLVAMSLARAFQADFWCGHGVDHSLIRRGLALEEELPRLPLPRRPSHSYAFALMWSGEVDRARPLYERLRALGRAEADLGVVVVMMFSVFHELVAEDWEQAARQADEASMLAMEAERDVETAMCLWGRAYVAAYRGHLERVRSDTAHAERLAAATGFTGHAMSPVTLGLLDLSLGEPASALAHLRPSTQRMVAGGLREPALLLGFPEHVEAAVACGELDEAGELLDFVEEHARRLDRAWALGCAARGRALLAAARGEEAAAEAAFALAYEQHARRPQQLPTYELARTLLAHGSILRRRQQKRSAREALERAQAIFERLGAAVYAERARSELARIGGRAATTGDELSETERRIADLVAQGLSNKEVATELSLSPKTVEWNLSKVYAKLGVRSRAELAGRRR